MEDNYVPLQYLNVSEAETEYFQKELLEVRKKLEIAKEALKDSINAMKGCRCRGGYETINDDGEFITIGDAQDGAEEALQKLEDGVG